MVLATSQQEFSDADFRVVDNGDQSKKLAFQVSGIATATTRVWTVPNVDVTVTPFAATILDDTTAGAVLTTLGVSAYVQTLLDDADAATARTTLGLGTAAVVADSSLVHIAGAETITGRKNAVTGTTGNSGMATGTGSLGELEIRGNGTGAAMLAFHRPSSFAAYIGLDTDNVWKVGGWSHGAVAYRLYHQNTILGAVSQSGGVPTGAVIERGSNGNGEYTRFADGTQICWDRHSVGAGTVWTYPAAFASAPRLAGMTAGSRVVAFDSAPGTTSVPMSRYITSTEATGAANSEMIAIGRWF